MKHCNIFNCQGVSKSREVVRGPKNPQGVIGTCGSAIDSETSFEVLMCLKVVLELLLKLVREMFVAVPFPVLKMINYIQFTQKLMGTDRPSNTLTSLYICFTVEKKQPQKEVNLEN